MYITEPAKIAAWSEERLTEGFLQNRLAILEHALENIAKKPSAATLTDAVQFIRAASGIILTAPQFERLLELYPYVRAKVADYGWGDTEVEDLVLDVVANAFLGTRWPRGVDNCDIKAFVERLRFASAKGMHLIT